MTLLFAFLHTYPFCKGVYSKRNELAPPSIPPKKKQKKKGSRFFPFRVDPFSEGWENTLNRNGYFEKFSAFQREVTFTDSQTRI